MGRIRIAAQLLSRAVHAVTGNEPCCRFEPSCSHYAEEAVHRFGLIRGVGLFLVRVLRCRPGGGAGWDPVPPK